MEYPRLTPPDVNPTLTDSAFANALEGVSDPGEVILVKMPDQEPVPVAMDNLVDCTG